MSQEIPDHCDRRVTKIFDYWRSVRPAPDVLPGRQHINPAALADLLPFIWLCDVQRKPLRFRYRLIGSVPVRAMGHDYTGEWLDVAHEAFNSSAAHADFVSAVENKIGAYYKGLPLFHVGKDYILMERILLPLARNGHDVDMLLGVSTYHAKPRST